MFNELLPAIKLLCVCSVIAGILTPITTNVLAQIGFAHQAKGSMIVDHGQTLGSALIGQSFDQPEYFWGRPSTTAAMKYDAAASSGSNLGPTNPALIAMIGKRIAHLHAADPDNKAPIPVDLVTASGSGLDPDISPAAAEYQVARVAKARGLDEAIVRRLVAEFTSGRTLGLLGEWRVNVLQLNLALDKMKKYSTTAAIHQR